MKYAFISSVLIIFVLISGSAFPALLQQSGEEECIPFSEFSVSGIALLEKDLKVRKVLGKPRVKIQEAAEDTSGQYFISTWHFTDFNLELVRGLVTRIYTKSSAVGTPSGIHPGLSYDQVLGILGKGPAKPITAGKLVFPGCLSPERKSALSMKLTFDSHKVLSSIDLTAGEN